MKMKSKTMDWQEMFEMGYELEKSNNGTEWTPALDSPVIGDGYYYRRKSVENREIDEYQANDNYLP